MRWNYQCFAPKISTLNLELSSNIWNFRCITSLSDVNTKKTLWDSVRWTNHLYTDTVTDEANRCLRFSDVLVKHLGARGSLRYGLIILTLVHNLSPPAIV